jgi:hypothetical protein
MPQVAGVVNTALTAERMALRVARFAEFAFKCMK